MYITLLKQVITKPNTAFEKICSSDYFALSVLIFTIFCVIGFFTNYSGSFSPVSQELSPVSQELSPVMGITYHITNVGGVFFTQILLILVIFLIGKKFGGNTDFKKTFSVLSFCVIPLIIGSLILSSSSSLYSIDFPVDTDYDLSPSPALDFAFSMHMLHNFIMVPFLIWSMILYIKAIKISNGFSTTKSILLLVSAGLMVSGARVLYDAVSSLPFVYQASFMLSDFTQSL